MFYRSQEETDLSGLPAKSRDNLLVALEKETLIVSLGAKLKIAKLKTIRDWFYDNNFLKVSKAKTDELVNACKEQASMEPQFGQP